MGARAERRGAVRVSTYPSVVAQDAMRVRGLVLLLGATAEAFVPAPSRIVRSSCLLEATSKHNNLKSFSRPISSPRPAAASRERRWVGSFRAPRMWEGEGDAQGVGEEEGRDEEEDEEEEEEGEASPGYTDVTVREAVEWTMGRDSEFTYIDVRSAEEHGKLATVRGALCIPAFERATPKAPPPPSPEGTGDESEVDSEPIPVYEADYDYEELEWKFLPDFVERMKEQFDLSAKLLIGCKTNRSAEACRLLVDAGFTEIYNVESQIFMRTRAPQVWE